MSVQAKITSKCQLTLPKEVRERHGLKPGDRVEFVEENGRTWIRARNVRVVDLIGILGPSPVGRPLSLEEIGEGIMDAVAEDDARIMREWHEGRDK